MSKKNNQANTQQSFISHTQGLGMKDTELIVTHNHRIVDADVRNTIRRDAMIELLSS